MDSKSHAMGRAKTCELKRVKEQSQVLLKRKGKDQLMCFDKCRGLGSLQNDCTDANFKGLSDSDIEGLEFHCPECRREGGGERGRGEAVSK